MKNLIKEVRGNIYGMGVYCFESDGKVLYVGSGMLNDRLQSHLYNMKRGLYEGSNKDILQRQYNIGELSFKVLHFSENNSTYINGTQLERKAIQKALQVLEQFYYNMYKDTICNQVSVIKKFTTSPTPEVTERRRQSNLAERNPNAKFTVEQVKEIKRLLDDGLDYQEIADKFNSTYGYIAQIKNGYKWASVN